MAVSQPFSLRALAASPRFDLVLAASFAVLLQVEVWFFQPEALSAATGPLAASVLGLIAAASLAFRRTHPLGAYLINTAAVMGLAGLGNATVVYQWINFIGIYSVASHGNARQARASIGLALAMIALYFTAVPGASGYLEAAAVAAIWITAWLAGRLYGARLRELKLIRQRDANSKALAEERARLVIEEERNRLAQEIHDLLGHTLNVIVMHAGAGRLAVDNNPAKVRHVLNTIEETGRSAMDELDELLDQMDQGDDLDNQPVPGIADLGGLSTRITAGDLPVSLQVDGDVSSVPPGVSFAVYRVVQEAMTNTIRHANASKAEISINVSADSVDISVSDDGDGVGELTPGRGLIGARERFALHGGNLEWRNQEAGGLTLEGHIPFPGPDD